MFLKRSLKENVIFIVEKSKCMKYDVSLMTVERIDYIGPYPFTIETEVLELRPGQEESVTWQPLLSPLAQKTKSKTATVLSPDIVSVTSEVTNRTKNRSTTRTRIFTGKAINRIRLGSRLPHREIIINPNGTRDTFIDLTAPVKLRWRP